VIAACGGVVFLGEQPTLRILLAAVAILGGVTLVSVGPKKKLCTGST